MPCSRPTPGDLEVRLIRLVFASLPRCLPTYPQAHHTDLIYMFAKLASEEPCHSDPNVSILSRRCERGLVGATCLERTGRISSPRRLHLAAPLHWKTLFRSSSPFPALLIWKGVALASLTPGPPGWQVSELTCGCPSARSTEIGSHPVRQDKLPLRCRRIKLILGADRWE